MWSKNVVDFLQTQSTFHIDQVARGCSVHDLTLDLVILPLFFQIPDISTKSCVVFTGWVPKIPLMLIPMLYFL